MWGIEIYISRQGRHSVYAEYGTLPTRYTWEEDVPRAYNWRNVYVCPFVSIGVMVSIFTRQHASTTGLQRKEIVAAIAEVSSIFVIFIVAFTGRDAYGDSVRQLLVALSLTAGALGTLAGLWVLLRGVQIPAARPARFALGGFMATIGIYTIVHVL